MSGVTMDARNYLLEFFLSVVASHNKQLERAVMRNHVRAASASFHYALASRFIRQRVAAELRRYATRIQRIGAFWSTVARGGANAAGLF